jgi:hypothetical protein
MKLRGLLAIVILGLVAFLRPMAFASPPDQSWLGGFFDDADYDDVILLIMGASPAATIDVVPDTSPAVVVVVPVAEAGEESAPTPLLSSHDTRAPPAV